MKLVKHFNAGDSVYVGAPRPTKVHWDVIHPTMANGLTLLQSPMSGRRRFEMAEALTLHTPASATREGAAA